MISRLTRKLRTAVGLWKNHGGTYAVLHSLARYFPVKGAYRRWANSLSTSRLPEQLVSIAGVYTNQAWEYRVEALEKLAAEHLSGNFVAMEIGTWFGQGSTKIWMRRMREGSQLFLVDVWANYITEIDKAGDSAYAAMNDVHHIAMNSALRVVYEHENASKGDVFVLRGSASRACRLFKDASFDFIYVDGSHYYADVVEDIKLAKVLLKDGGVLCGDDLEVAPTQERILLARQNLDKDFIQDEGGTGFHPGVLLAVHENFPQFTNRSGIWSVRKRGTEWVAV
jgi:hypothetical protein